MQISLKPFVSFNSDYKYKNQRIKSYPKDTVSFSSNYYKNYKDEDFRKKVKEKIETVKTTIENNLGKPFSEVTAVELFNEFGMLEKIDDDGLIILKEYKQPHVEFDWKDLGIDENHLFKNVKEIKGNADFFNSNILHLDKLKKIGGWANFSHSQIINLKNLQEIGDWAMFQNSKIISLGNLRKIGTDAIFEDSKIYYLGNLQEIGADAKFGNSMIHNLCKLQKIGGDAIFDNSNVIHLGNLQEVGGSVYYKYSKLKKQDFSSINIKQGFVEDYGEIMNLLQKKLMRKTN